MNILVTGGCGFIGANFLNMVVPKYPEHIFINVDIMSYAANPNNILCTEYNNYEFIKADISDYNAMNSIFHSEKIDAVINIAAESHVERSVHKSRPFIDTNIIGTYNLLELARLSNNSNFRFYQISTDEVYGESIGTLDNPDDIHTEKSQYKTKTPYAASKAAGDLLVECYNTTHGLNTVVSNCTNNYGPMQHKEKFIPFIISRVLSGDTLPLHGDGTHKRDWIYVGDHCSAMEKVFFNGRPGQKYNIAGGNRLTNYQIVDRICKILQQRLGINNLKSYIRFIPDRKGNDIAYNIDCSKMCLELDWFPSSDFDYKFERTVDWYLDNRDYL